MLYGFVEPRMENIQGIPYNSVCSFS